MCEKKYMKADSIALTPKIMGGIIKKSRPSFKSRTN
jgi:hypothetical protein